MYWKAVYVIGTDLNGRKCRVAKVRVPASFTREQALKHIRNLTSGPNHAEPFHKPYAVVDEIEGSFEEKP